MRKRSKHSLSHYRMATCDMGQIIPVACVPVLPGDTFQQSTNALIRVSPLNTPVMHPVTVRIHHFFVPNRITWDGWEDFITGGSDGLDASTIPKSGGTITKSTLAEYLGIPPTTTPVSLLPWYAYNKIINEFYRDQDLVPERSLTDNTIANCAWEKDYFTTARPFSQKGAEVTLPVGNQAPVGTDSLIGSLDTLNILDGSGAKMNIDPLTSQIAAGTAGNGEGLYADLSAAGAININDFRAGFALQRYQEARARYGSRFTEYLRYLGITPSDARLQRPEYLGGGSTRLNFSEVLQTSEGAQSGIGVGDLYGHGIAGVRTNKYRRFFEEHGYVLTLLSTRPKSLYINGIPRDFLKSTKEDFFQRELANLGQQEVWKGELFADGNKETFGYQDRYDEYRSHPSQIGQDFRDVLNAWHLGRDLDTSVTLNEDFVKCTPSKRIHQVETNDVLWCMVNNKIVARRMVPKKANPRIL